MAKQKKETEMTPAVEEQKPIVAVAAIEVTDLKPKQTVTDLDTMEDIQILIVYKSYTPSLNKDGSLVAGEAETLAAAQALVTPAAKQITALLKFATSEAYQEAKRAAFAKGNYLTPELKRMAVSLMSNLDAYSSLSAKDLGERWMTGVREKKPGALKWLERARAILDAEETDF